MEGTIADNYIKMQLDIIPTHQDWTDEDYDKFISEQKKEEESMTEWPDI